MKLTIRCSSVKFLIFSVLIIFNFAVTAAAQGRITKVTDFNRDGKADLLWRNPSTGESVAWLMDGTSTLGSAALLHDPNWRIAAAADFNGDGMGDLLLRNASTGQIIQWLMNGTSVSSWTMLLADPAWKVLEAADLNGDQKADLILHNASTAQTVAWLMNGGITTSSSLLMTDANWNIVATGDFNGDRNADLLWYNAATGQTASWLMNGTTQLSAAVLGGSAGWKVSATADFNGDGMADILWYGATTGETVVWLMNGITTTASATLLWDPFWKVATTADLDGDGKSDLLWNNSSTGQTTAWLMNGTVASGIAALINDLNWKINATGDLDNDGKSDLLWYNEATGQTSAWLMNGTRGTRGANLFTDPNWRLECIKGSSITAVLACDDSAYLSVGNMPLSPNKAPIVSAGSDQTVTLQTTAKLLGIAEDDARPIGLLTTSWSQVSGPGSAVFSDATFLRSTVTFSRPGTYGIRLTATDSGISSFDDLVIVVNGGSSGNMAPVVNAGADQTVMFPAGTILTGTAIDDNLPTGSVLSLNWSTVSGPGNVVFSQPTSPTSQVEFFTSGTYTLRLTVSDGVLAATDDVVVVSSGSTSGNQPPVVSAGPDQTITFPAGANLSGTATDDGLPTGSAMSVQWSKISGPGTITFVNAASLNATATFSTAGTYTIRLTASDGVLSSNDDVVIVADTASFAAQSFETSSEESTLSTTNQAPIVNAGVDQSILFPAGTLLTGTVSDDGFPIGSIYISWSKVSGPGTVVFNQPTSLTTGATFFTEGTYTLRLTAGDGEQYSSDDIVVFSTTTSSSSSSSSTNLAPVVNAGPDQTIAFQTGALLTGTASDDGLPAGSTHTRLWSLVSGPGMAIFNQPTSLQTNVTLSMSGTYVIRFTATDGSLSTSDDVVIVANTTGTSSSSSNQAPLVNAGPDQTIVFQAGALLRGSTSDDGLPTGSTLTRMWSLVSGPGTVIFNQPTSLETNATLSIAGTYTIRLTATDGSLSTSDDVVISTSITATSSTNQAPLVNAGPDHTIVLQAGALLTGSTSDDGLPAGSTHSRVWSLVSGPGSAIFNQPTSLQTNVTLSTAGTYTVRLTATDGALSSSDDVVIYAGSTSPTNPAPVVDPDPDQSASSYSSSSYAAPLVVGNIVYAASCLQADVQAAVNAAANGHTVTIPACRDGVQWDGLLTITKAITVQGSACTLDGQQRPLDCGTVIIDGGFDQEPIISFKLVANQNSRLTNIEIRDGGRRPDGGANAVVRVQGQNGGGVQDNRRFRVDHSRFIQLKGLAPSVQTAWGVVDHNYYEMKSGPYFAVYFYQPADYDYSDARWAEATDWGSDRFLFIENNTFTRPAGSPHYALIDAYGGARVVVRFNDITASWLEAHGTESAGRARGTRAVEAYKNNFTGNNGGGNIVNVRSGPVMIWGNTAVGYQSGANAANLNNERTLGLTAFGVADGTSPWDVNRGVMATYNASTNSTAVAGLTQTVRVFGAGWATNQWSGYSIHKVGCVSSDSSQACGLLILSNNSDTITYEVDRSTSHLDFAAGDLFTINLITHVLDGPCRSGGTKLSYRFTPSITYYGPTATVTLNGHGFSTGDYVSIWDTGDPYRGTFQITVTGPDTFTVTLGASPVAPSTFATITRVPFGWNDQITDSCYQWQNTENGSNAIFNAAPYNVQIRANEQYFDYEPSKLFDGSIAIDRSSVGAGPLANLPAVCTTGVAYWATDDGEWDSTHPGPDGRLYRCTAANTWSVLYTPAAFPLPLTLIP